MKIDYQNELAPVGTVLTSTAILPGNGNTTCWDQSTSGRHAELGEYIGLFVSTSAYNHVGTETYQFQVINDSATNGTTSPVVVADTGTMQNTDTRITGGSLFLPIPPFMLTKEYVFGKFIGANTPSWTGGAWIMTQAQYQQWIAEPENFTP